MTSFKSILLFLGLSAFMLANDAVSAQVKSSPQQAGPAQARQSGSSTANSWSIGRPDMIPTADAIDQIRERIRKNPADYLSMTVLGQLYYRDAKERDDHQSFMRAERAFRDAIAISPDNKSANIYLITALQAQHQFHAALEQSYVALKLAPDNLVAISSLGDALLELGNVDEAKKAFDRVAEKIKTPGVLARLARIAELKGNTVAAIDLIIEARDSSIAFEEKPETTSWYDFRLGLLYFGRGQFDLAAFSYAEGLRRNPGDTKCLDGLAQVRVAGQEYDVAKNLYVQSLALKSAPQSMAALGDLFALTGELKLANQWLDRAEAAMDQTANSTAGTSHLRERAKFLLDHDRNLPLALQLAEQDLSNRQDIYTYDTLAWALYKNNEYTRAQEAINQATRLGTLDAEIWFHAGMIASKNGENEVASACLAKCLEINPGFSVADAELARVTLQSIVSMAGQ